MAILMGSSTPIELLLKEALKKEGLEFKEQQRIYELPGDLQPKYIVDFVVVYQNKSVVVECDGFAYHTSDRDTDRDIRRDNWLKQNGYGTVMHFTAFQLQYEMKKVILNIKQGLGIVNLPKSKLKFEGKKRQTKQIKNVDEEGLHQVILYYSVKQVNDAVWVVYKYQDKTLNRFSEERIRAFKNVPEKVANELAIYTALKDLKKPVELFGYCQVEWLTAYLNRSFKAKKDSCGLLKKIDAILEHHNYKFQYINTYRSPDYYDRPTATRLIHKELQSRCNQVRHGKCKSFDYDGIVDFTELKD